MKKKLCILTAASALSLGTSVNAQGLLSIGRHDEFATKMPFTWAVGLGAGWDSNVNQASYDEKDSAFLTASLQANYNTGDRRTSYAVGASYSPRFYFDAPPGTEEYQHSANLNFSLQHRINPRMTLNDNLYFAYEFEPNFEIGAAGARRADPYLYGSNSTSLAYSWTRRFSTVTSYTFSGIDYQDNERAESQNYYQHLISEEFRYAFTKTTTAALTYRYAIAEYDDGYGDYTSHYLLTGLDHSFSRKTYGSFRVGAEFRDRDNGGDATNPYFEGTFTHSVAKNTTINWFGRLGFDDSDVSGSSERYSFRTGLSARQQFTARLAGNLGLNYVHDEYDFSDGSYNNDIVAVVVGLDYQFYRNLILNAGYSFTTCSSDNDFSEYDRHTVSVGVTARF
ncbi:MAG: outer membrane beta-barrel protein [Verrucomicrobiota bacterium]